MFHVSLLKANSETNSELIFSPQYGSENLQPCWSLDNLFRTFRRALNIAAE